MTKLSVENTKSKTMHEFDTETLPEAVYVEALKLGLKVLLNRGQSKITKASTKDDAEMKALAKDQAEKNVEAINAGKIKFSGGAKAKKASGAIMTEARRLAKALVKDEMKKAGIKVSHVEAKEITNAANELLNTEELGKQLLAQAEENIKAREAKVESGLGIDIKALIKESPKLVAKAEEEKAARKSQLSATQAGKPKKSKPQAAAMQ